MSAKAPKKTSTKLTAEEILKDYALVAESREASLLGRKEVFMGKAKFGIFGDGKEVAQVAMAKAFKNGDIRSGYYRDQTFMMAIGQLTTQQFFAQLYAHTDPKADPSSAGRLMNSHFATRMVNDKGEWKTLTDMKNSSADISCTAGQMPRLVGLAYASKLYRNNESLSELHDFSINGNEVAFGTIGNASTSEGHFWEALNAVGVLQLPLIMAIWDDDYGISVPKEYHTTRSDLSLALSGFQRSGEGDKGFELKSVVGWDYMALCETFVKSTQLAREQHVPAIIHVKEMTQPQGHSTSGSHERYKSKERLKWEAEHDCMLKMREWMIEEGIASAAELTEIEKDAKARVKEAKNAAWKEYTQEIKYDMAEAETLLMKASQGSPSKKALLTLKEEMTSILNPVKNDVYRTMRLALRQLRNENNSVKRELNEWIKEKREKFDDQYSSHLYSESDYSAKKVKPVAPAYADDAQLVDGREVLQACFDDLLTRDPRVFAIGEDVGKIGDVNQGFAGLQDKHGKMRVMDTSIRETTIVGQGIGAAMRGLRPIVEIQYLDYVFYAIQTLSDDLATLQYRTKGGQKAPMIIRTRGHRLEGVWHSGSPMSSLLSALRGIYILTPRDMTQAAGMYNTMMSSDDTAIIVECLNGYRLKERIPSNIGEFKVELGVPNILKTGSDITIVTYGSMCKIVMEAAHQLEELGIHCEVMDVQTLIPFDKNHLIVESLKKTNRLLLADEDVPGGATGYMMQNVLEHQGGYKYLDSAPATLSGRDHRPAYGTDGDYFSNPNVEDVVEKVYNIMNESSPEKYPMYLDLGR